MGIAGLVTGLVGLLLSWVIPIVGIILGALGIILGGVGIAQGRRAGTGTGMAVAGVVLGALAVVLAIVMSPRSCTPPPEPAYDGAVPARGWRRRHAQAASMVNRLTASWSSPLIRASSPAAR
jgi:hypothetical protein